MPRLLLLVLLSVSASTATAQITIPPVSAPHAPIVATCGAPPAGEEGSVQILWESDPATQYIPLDGGQTLHVWAGPGEHYLKASVFAVDWENRTFSVQQYRATFRVGGDDPPPTPDPTPEPDPPTPKPSQVTAVIIRESEDDTPAFARLLTGLRTGEAARWLAAGGHDLIVVDDDATDADGRPLKLVASLSALGVSMPALFLLSGDDVILKETLPASATADQVLAKIRGAVE